MWLIFEFHDNTNQHGASLKAKVRPPRHDSRVGLFSTRSPHRPNAIGLSLVRLDRVQGDTLFFLGADLLDGTPILDVKPYCPSTDSADDPVRGAHWLTPREAVDYARVEIAPDAAQEMRDLQGQFEMYETAEQMETLVKQVLALEIRSAHRREMHETHSVRLDSIIAHYTVDDDSGAVTVVKVEKFRA